MCVLLFGNELFLKCILRLLLHYLLQSFFFFHGIVKLIEYFYQLPSVADVVPNIALHQLLALTHAAGSFI